MSPQNQHQTHSQLPSDSWPALSAKQQQTLEQFGISLDRYHLFLRTFVPHRWDWTAGSINGRWYAIQKRPLVHSDIIGHLAGRRFVGARAARVLGRPTTRFVAFDVDVHEGDPNWRRLEILREAFGPPLLFRSSASKGRHAYYFLPESVPIDRLFDGRQRASDGLLWRALCEMGLEPKSGWLELYPTGCSRDKGSELFRCGNALRLPFGSGSALLSPTDLRTPITEDPLQAFHIVMNAVEHGTIPTLSLEHLAKLAHPVLTPVGEAAAQNPESSPQILGTDTSRRKRSRPVLRAATVAVGESALDGEFKHGLTGPGQTNAGLLAAAKQMSRLCADRQELLDNVLAWFGSNHNGHSGTLAHGGWPAVTKKASEAVEWAWERRSLGAVPALTPREVHRIRAMAHWATTRTQMAIPLELRFKLEFLMSELAQRAKQWVLWRVIEMRVALLSEHPVLHDDANELADRLAEAIEAKWPSAAGQIFTVPMPWRLRARLPGISLRVMAFLFQELKYMGFIRLSKNYSTASGAAAEYDIELDFSALVPLSTSPMPWEALVHLVVPELTTRQERTRHTATRIDELGTAAARERFGITEHTLASLMQAGACWSCAQQELADAAIESGQNDDNPHAAVAGEAV